jgi:hypothetical protein
LKGKKRLTMNYSDNMKRRPSDIGGKINLIARYPNLGVEGILTIQVYNEHPTTIAYADLSYYNRYYDYDNWKEKFPASTYMIDGLGEFAGVALEKDTKDFFALLKCEHNIYARGKMERISRHCPL